MLSFDESVRRGGEMADATDLKSVDRKVVWVRLPPSAPTFNSFGYNGDVRFRLEGAYAVSEVWKSCAAQRNVIHGRLIG